MVGFDDIAMADWPPYCLTTVRQPVAEMVEETAHLLSGRIAGKRTRASVTLIPGTLVERGSTRDRPAKGESPG